MLSQWTTELFHTWGAKFCLLLHMFKPKFGPQMFQQTRLLQAQGVEIYTEARVGMLGR